MKTLFVVLPQCIEKALEAAAQIALAASTELGEYLQLISNSAPYGWGLYCEDARKSKELTYITSAVESMSRADYVAFAPEWQKYKECRVLHDISEQYELDIIECEVPKLTPEPELKSGLKACPFCGETEILTCACEDTEYGKEYSVFCSTCRTSGPTANSESDTIELWNSRE